jgi:hypothetical protein
MLLNTSIIFGIDTSPKCISISLFASGMSTFIYNLVALVVFREKVAQLM